MFRALCLSVLALAVLAQPKVRHGLSSSSSVSDTDTDSDSDRNHNERKSLIQRIEKAIGSHAAVQEPVSRQTHERQPQQPPQQQQRSGAGFLELLGLAGSGSGSGVSGAGGPGNASLRSALDPRPGPRLNLPPGAPADFDYQSEEGQAALRPPQIRSGDCGNAPVVPAKVPAWTGGGADGAKPEWCLSTPAAPRGDDSPVYLAAHLYVRIYDGDLPQLSKLDIAHHMTYYRYAGYERVYLYDNWLYEWEKVDAYPPIAEAIASGFCVYVDWHEGAKANWDYQQRKAVARFMYKVQYPESGHVMDKYHGETRWMSFMDLDEYPVQSTDFEPGFFSRFLVHHEQAEDRADKSQTGACRRITQFTLPNYLVWGHRDRTKGPLLMQQVERVVNAPLNALVKQIVRMDARSGFAVHTSRVKFGATRSAYTKDNLLRMYHLQGGRGTQWKTLAEMSFSERAKIMKGTFQIDMGPIPERVLMCYDEKEMAAWPSIEEERKVFEASHPNAYP